MDPICDFVTHASLVISSIGLGISIILAFAIYYLSSKATEDIHALATAIKFQLDNIEEEL